MKERRHWVELPEFLQMFKAYRDNETDDVLINTKREAQIIDGVLKGTEICVRKDGYLCWTPKKTMAKRICEEHRIKGMWNSGPEAQVLIPHTMPEQTIIMLLLKFWAQKKRVMSKEHQDALKTRLAGYRQNRILAREAHQNGHI